MIWEKIPARSFSAQIVSNRSKEAQKKVLAFQPLGKSQGDHALFRPWEFLVKIIKFPNIVNQDMFMLYSHVFDTTNRLKPLPNLSDH